VSSRHLNAGLSLIMSLPVDPKMTELQALYGRAAFAHKATRDAEYEARLKEECARQEYYDYVRERGYCPLCEAALSECMVHGDDMDRRREDRRQD